MKLKINIKNPIISSVLCIIITFVITIIVLSIAKPSYITEVSDKGDKKVNVYLLVFISLLFGILIGIAKLIFFSKTTTAISKITAVKNNFALNPMAYRP